MSDISFLQHMRSLRWLGIVLFCTVLAACGGEETRPPTGQPNQPAAPDKPQENKPDLHCAP
ncbi:MAG: hypothetical protein EPN70_08035 [Paraburkholderia sp.]|uniref:hypothetical protein n=1 Tax=Paraburkholderia sp. TaxID=1926495 RepID=UPI00120CB66C|nr:hypothetical protein [Paraburkholderia sp.]TAM05602.1 MAG: hypothetical protein EPN70_08035 [Paraburkholderia sp.]